MGTLIERGQQAEDIACQYLKALGFGLLERNYRCQLGEIDLIMRHAKAVHFVEVKARWTRSKGRPLDQVTARKMRQISRVAVYYLQGHPLYAEQRALFSVIGIDNSGFPQQIHWVPDAFDLQGPSLY